MSNRTVSWVVFVVLCFIWGSSFILMRYSTGELSSSQIAAVRIFSAGLVFLPFGLLHIRKIPRNKFMLVILSGVFGNLVPSFLFAEAIAENIDSSIAGILNSLTPVWVVGIAVIFFNDKIRSSQIWGVMLGFAGMVALTLTRDDFSLENIGYSALIVLGTLSYGININMISHYLKGVNPLHMATVSLSFMMIPAGLVLWQQDFLRLHFSDPKIADAVWASVGLGVGGSAIASVLFYYLVQKAGGLFASLVTYGIPFIALFWGFMYGEKVTLIEIACLLVILCGVYLANRKKTEAETE